eukprot:TRINITY_DN36009_c0_g1_i2.p1 TRINITY_DN36009_c0_g1~~TRINITY_DN36009_c0_g1_i2.p1  ORF type:complete len:596 (-),score=130.83 TRINITY_DN36009_c0_g1_i2:46-1833(-)
MHGAPAVRWNSDIAREAEVWLHRFPPMVHANSFSLVPPQAENLAYSMTFKDIMGRVKSWYSEVQYCSALPGCQNVTQPGAETGHFTALVWRSVLEIGCSADQGNDGAWYYICRYAAGPVLGLDTPNMPAGCKMNVPAIVKSEAQCRALLDKATGLPKANAPDLENITGGSPGGAAGGGQPPLQVWLKSHNYYRCLHGAPEVMWNPAMAASAQEWVERMPPMQHSRSYDLSPPSAENLAENVGKQNVAARVAEWYGEQVYCASFPGCEASIKEDKQTTAFTAMIWRSVREIGCGSSQGSDGKWYYVCRYSSGPELSLDTPNIAGGFTTNVFGAKPSEEKCRRMYPIAMDMPASHLAQPEKQQWLEIHNVFRCMHAAPAMKWSLELAEAAREWLDKFPPMRPSNRLAATPQYAENLAVGTGEQDVPGTVRKWYDEVLDCDELPGCRKSRSGDSSVADFRALVWKAASTLGCASKLGKDGSWYYICRYASGSELSSDTPDIEGGFVENVLPAVKSASQCARGVYLPPSTGPTKLNKTNTSSSGTPTTSITPSHTKKPKTRSIGTSTTAAPSRKNSNSYSDTNDNDDTHVNDSSSNHNE